MQGPKLRRIANFSESSLHQLNAYALVATAAGIGVLALAQPAQARIVYTPKLVDCSRGCLLDLNNDGQTDFAVGFFSNNTSSGWTESSIGPLFYSSYGRSNRVVGTRHLASALRAGVRIETATVNGALMAWAAGRHGKEHSFGGSWANRGKGVKNRYLGLKFYIKGKAHYGWARFSVGVADGIQAKLTGYAYETIPNKPIIAGKTKGQNFIAAQPATLGHLAQGASAISDWRAK
jgi:hypothetical protein